MTFLIYADKNYFDVTWLNLHQIKKIYPGAKITLIDIGFSFEQAEKLSLLKEVHLVKFPIKESMPKYYKLFLKPFLLLKYWEPGIIYMDADTILLHPIDQVLVSWEDITVTVRDHSRLFSKINSGFFLVNNPNLLLDWMELILREILLNPSDWNEQDALNKLCEFKLYKFKEIPCYNYNYTEVEKGITPDNKIIHLKKKRRFNKELMNNVKHYIRNNSNL